MKKKTPDIKNLASDFEENFFREVQIEFLIHELKGPVAIIETGVRTLLEKQEKYGHLNARQQKTLQRVLKNSQKTRTMLHDLLEIGRSQAGCFLCCRFLPAKAAYETLLDVLEIMAINLYEELKGFEQKQDALDFLARNGIFLDITPEVRQAEIFQDETKFRQVVGNLIKNALHYRNQHLTIKMEIENDFFNLYIIDDGPGVKPEDHENIFRRYTQAKENSVMQRTGHGLGLAGALITARCLGGNIRLESDEGRGATFRLNVPLTFKDSTT